MINPCFEKLTQDAIKALCREVHDTAKSKGWWAKDRNDDELLMLIVSELSEALEWLRKPEKTKSDHIPDFPGVVEELADAVIRIADMCEARGYSLGEAIIAKMKFNETRPIRHGGKKF